MDDDIDAYTTKSAKVEKIKTWDLLGCRGGYCVAPVAHVAPAECEVPFNRRVAKCIMASLKKAKYRSAHSYLELAVKRHSERGGTVSQADHLFYTRYKRSARRGIGATKRCPGFPVIGMGMLR